MYSGRLVPYTSFVWIQFGLSVDPTLIAAAFSVLLVAMGAIYAIRGSTPKPAITSNQSARVESLAFGRLDIRRQLQHRLGEARQLLKRQERVGRQNQVASTTLIFGQYVVGGVLASSFVQESLSKGIVGSLGVAVLVASLIQQRYRPDLKARLAKLRIVRLRALIRHVEDILTQSEEADDASWKELTAVLSDGIAEVEALEAQDLLSGNVPGEGGHDTAK